MKTLYLRASTAHLYISNYGPRRKSSVCGNAGLSSFKYWIDFVCGVVDFFLTALCVLLLLHERCRGGCRRYGRQVGDVMDAAAAGQFDPRIPNGYGNCQYPIFECVDGRIALLFLSCVASHTAFRPPSTASRHHLQKRDIGNFRTPKCVASWSANAR